ncbi:MAG: DUF1330 domain-containing protein [Pseudomonadales bacterium]|nr:DUF1330 domain-containing protein [Gammaproteobacteria bacterium]NNL57174.1 DUF1330 domain-containing protein [Pseudomonadales bacterium]
MTVYVVVQVKITVRETYDRYQSNFMEVFNQFDGKLLANDESPRLLEGDWDKDKLVLIAFPDKGAFTAWATSSAYTEIAKDRLAGGEATILLVQGLDDLQQV